MTGSQLSIPHESTTKKLKMKSLYQMLQPTHQRPVCQPPYFCIKVRYYVVLMYAQRVKISELNCNANPLPENQLGLLASAFTAAFSYVLH